MELKKSYSFPSDIKNLEMIEEISTKIMTEAGFNESCVDDISIALTELVNNAIHHGNHDDISKSVKVDFVIDAHKATICVEDEGEGFEPAAVQNPLDPEKLMAENGRGIYLVKALMDEVAYTITQSGTRVTFSKNISSETMCSKDRLNENDNQE